MMDYVSHGKQQSSSVCMLKQHDVYLQAFRNYRNNITIKKAVEKHAHLSTVKNIMIIFLHSCCFQGCRITSTI